MMSLHCHNAFAKRRSKAQNLFLAVRTAMIEEDVVLVAGDSNGARWRRKAPTSHSEWLTHMQGAFEMKKIKQTISGRGYV